jgi:hypothetical protein
MRGVIGGAALAVIGLGQSVSGWQDPVIGYALMGVGVLLALSYAATTGFVKARAPYVIVRNPRLTVVGPSADRYELLRVAREVSTELETARYQLEEAKAARLGWHSYDMLPAAKFDAWQKSLATVTEGEVHAAMQGYYIWAHRMNIAMQVRESKELNAVGTLLEGDGLTLSNDDLLELDEGLTSIDRQASVVGGRRAVGV